MEGVGESPWFPVVESIEDRGSSKNVVFNILFSSQQPDNFDSFISEDGVVSSGGETRPGNLS